MTKQTGHNIISVKQDGDQVWTTAGTYTFGISPLVLGLIAVIFWQRYKGNSRRYW